MWESIKNLKWSEINILDILNGCANHFLVDFYNPNLREKIKKVAIYRLKFCAVCEINNNGTCDITKTIKNVETEEMVNGCGCNIKCKTALLEMFCPASKWKAIK